MFREFLTRLPYLLAACIPALTFHEWAHAVVAHQFGDDLPKRSGRLSLNPFVHLDFLGTIAIFLIGFGWAKPVPIEPSRLKGSWGAFVVALAGPAMNFILASIFAILLNTGLYLMMGPENGEIFGKICFASIQVNLAWAIFNLIPIGPLDGNHIVERLLPVRASLRYSQWNLEHGSMLLFVLIILDSLTPVHVISSVVMIPVQWVMTMMLKA